MKLKYLWQFYFTLGIPFLYFIVLYQVSRGNTITVPLLFQIFGLIMAGIGIFFWILSYLQLRGAFGVLPRTQKKVTTGLYGRYKHPMYIGIILTFFGLSLGNQSLSGIESTLLILLPILIIRAKLEERKLH